MKLPEEIPGDLLSEITEGFYLSENGIECASDIEYVYKLFANYFNNLPVDWRPVSEKPFQSMDVWLWDGYKVYLGRFINNKFYPQCYALCIVGDGNSFDNSNYQIEENDKYSPTHWTYAYLPEPPKEQGND